MKTDVVIETPYGKICGHRDGAVRIFKGVRYGASTGGAARFLPPRPPEPWAGIIEATTFGPSCPQPNRARAGRPPSVAEDPASVHQDEDCLFLNIWTPWQSGESLRPVMFWLHGGGFTVGSASAPLYDGTHLAMRQGVVVVSINHRLGPFGFMPVDCEEGSGANLGLQDIIAALRWVQQSIAAFGGDPGKITLFGESGGGLKISALLAMPMAQGLFHGAIIQSGVNMRMREMEDGLRVRRALCHELGIAPDDMDGLRTVPAQALVAAASACARAFLPRAPGFANGFTPVVDGVILPAHPFWPNAPSCSAHIPLLVGYNRTEATYFAKVGYAPNDGTLSLSGLKERLAPVFGNDLDDVVEAFQAAFPDLSPWDLYIHIFTEFPTGLFTRLVAAKRASLTRAAPTYLYRFDWETRAMGPLVRSPHMIELPFVFDTIIAAERMTGTAPETLSLAHRVSTAWANMAKHGRPSFPDGTPFPAYDPAHPTVMRINHHCAVTPPPAAALDRILIASLHDD